MNIELTLFPIETPFNTFENRADPDQEELPDKSCLIRYTLFAYENIRYEPILVDLTSNFFVLCTNMKIYLYNYP